MNLFWESRSGRDVEDPLLFAYFRPFRRRMGESYFLLYLGKSGDDMHLWWKKWKFFWGKCSVVLVTICKERVLDGTEKTKSSNQSLIMYEFLKWVEVYIEDFSLDMM